jgi:TetR/AcrR family tetracycline transcriptional repressor
VKLSTERIVEAGLATFAEVGYEGLSMRRVADRLNAQAGSLYYHVPSKDALLRLMSDWVAGHAYEAGAAALAALPGDAGWAARVEAQAVALRAVMRQHQGGAALIASSPHLLSTGALSLMERLQQTLAEAGVPAGECGMAADTLLSYVTGFVLQEQGDSVAPQITAGEFAALAERFPRTLASGSAASEDDIFTRSVRLLCRAFGTLIGSSPGS